MSASLLDASALLAWSFDETGATMVDEQLDRGAVITSVNLAEVLVKIVTIGGDPDELADDLRAYPLGVLDVTVEHASSIAGVRRHELRAGVPGRRLSLGDLCCLGVALAEQRPVVTADRSWAGLGLDVEVVLIR